MKAITRRVNKVVRALLILLIMMFSSVGCMRQEAKFEAGVFYYTNHPDQIMMGITSETDTFSMDNVTLDLHYGLYDIDYINKYNIDPKSPYTLRDFPDAETLFCLYIYDESQELDIYIGVEFLDYKEIEEYYFLKEISEEAFSGGYGYTISRWTGTTYEHKEKLAIPLECFDEDKGDLIVMLIAYSTLCENNKNYHTMGVGRVSFGYEKICDNQIKILF